MRLAARPVRFWRCRIGWHDWAPVVDYTLTIGPPYWEQCQRCGLVRAIE
jgi:hypothetical protein